MDIIQKGLFLKMNFVRVTLYYRIHAEELKTQNEEGNIKAIRYITTDVLFIT